MKLLFLLVFISGSLLAQILDGNYWSKLSVKEIYDNDKNNVISEMSYYKIEDSIICLSFKGYKWFVFPIAVYNKELHGCIFAMSEKDKSLHLITDSLFLMNTTMYSWEHIRIFRENVYFLHRYNYDEQNGIVGGIKLGLIDINNLKLKVEYYFPNGSWLDEIKIVNDTLYFYFQPLHPNGENTFKISDGFYSNTYSSSG